MNTLYLDIETLPGPAGCLDGKEFTAPANYKDADKIAAYVAEAKAEAIAKTGLDGAYGSVCMVAWAVDAGDVQANGAHPQSTEIDKIGALFDYTSAMLSRFNTGLPVICGHNVTFDLGFLKKRAIIHGIKLPTWFPINAKPWDQRIRDTMQLWGSDNRDMIGMGDLCRALGIPDYGDDISGKDVAACWARGEYEKVAAHCRADVEKVRAVNKRMIEAGV